MCYSALVKQKVKELGFSYRARVQIDLIEDYLRRRLEGEDIKMALGFDLEWIKAAETPGEKSVAALIKQCHRVQVGALETELFKQKRRLNEAEEKLAVKSTKVAENDKRISTSKISSILGKIEIIQKLKLIDANYRIYPKMFSPLVIQENGKRSVILARYGIRPAGESADFDKKYDGAYNARRDNLLRVKFWKDLLASNHCILPILRFYENVNLNGRNQILEFTPKGGGEVILPGLWDTWGNKQTRIDSFAVITDDPNPEVRAAGHDRTPVPLKDESLDTWLQSESKEKKEWIEFLGDKRSFFFEHSKVA